MTFSFGVFVFVVFFFPLQVECYVSFYLLFLCICANCFNCDSHASLEKRWLLYQGSSAHGHGFVNQSDSSQNAPFPSDQLFSWQTQSWWRVEIALLRQLILRVYFPKHNLEISFFPPHAVPQKTVFRVAVFRRIGFLPSPLPILDHFNFYSVY